MESNHAKPIGDTQMFREKKMIIKAIAWQTLNIVKQLLKLMLQN